MRRSIASGPMRQGTLSVPPKACTSGIESWNQRSTIDERRKTYYKRIADDRHSDEYRRFSDVRTLAQGGEVQERAFRCPRVVKETYYGSVKIQA